LICIITGFFYKIYKLPNFTGEFETVKIIQFTKTIKKVKMQKILILGGGTGGTIMANRNTRLNG